MRKRLDPSRPVPDEVITECLRLATQAPTGADVQNWRWVLAYALEPEGERFPPAVRYGSIFPAVWSFQLALRSRGLGSTPMYVDPAAVNEVVGAPPGAHLAALLPVAYYTGESFKPARRRPVEEIVFWQRWP